MDHNENIHLEIAENLLNERQLAENISRAIYNSLDALDAQLQRMIQNEIKMNAITTMENFNLSNSIVKRESTN